MQRGIVAVAPIWIGVVPFGVMLGVSARAAGFSPVESIAMSGLIFAGAAQVVTISLFSGGAGLIAITLTTFFLNLRHVLYAMSLDRRIGQHPQPGRPVMAFFLTDESYGITTRDYLEGRGSVGFYTGASLGLYVVYLISTTVGTLLGSVLPEPETIGLDFIFPLMFVALLIPLIKTRNQLIVVPVAACISLVAGTFLSGGITILVATILAAAFGAALDSRQ